MKRIILFYCSTTFALLTLISSVQATSSSVPVPETTSSTIVPKDTVDAVAIKDALSEFKSLTHKDKMVRIREAKAVLKKYRADKKAGVADGNVSTNTLLLVILAILLPPLAVALHEHGINGKFWLCLLLTLLFFLPGVIYALIVVLG